MTLTSYPGSTECDTSVGLAMHMLLTQVMMACCATQLCRAIHDWGTACIMDCLTSTHLI